MFTRNVKNQYIKDLIHVAELVEEDGYGGFHVSDSFLGEYIPRSRMAEIRRISLLDKRSVAPDIADLGFYTGANTWYKEKTCSCCPVKFCAFCGGAPHPFAECDDGDCPDKYKGPKYVDTMTLDWRGKWAKPSNELMHDDECVESFDPPGALYKFKLTAE